MIYRVYDTIKKKYVTGNYWWVITSLGRLAYIDHSDLKKMPDCIAEFSSGEADKNGVEIFEGDIVSLPAYRGGRHKSVVYFKGGKFAVDGSNYGFKDLAAGKYEVIGNIHDEQV